MQRVRQVQEIMWAYELDSGLGPGGGRYLVDLPVGHVGQAAQHIPKAGIGVDAAAAAAFNERVKDGAAVARDRGSKLLGRKLAGDEVLVIGDTQHDITCAQSIGARVLAVATGMYQVDALSCHKPTWCVPTLEHITPAEACC